MSMCKRKRYIIYIYRRRIVCEEKRWDYRNVMYSKITLRIIVIIDQRERV